ncbi:hypothetical protein [Streptococcus sp. DTU_2020_1000888_1_SI_GRL_NUU_041A]|uniref:hypothetical protein n=1 Tax=Streptococcus sp. DTU_2020_1000888_1_SI_GRL_NUU_041A TaxID=3077723 RepID=UPI0028EB0516|nr:hypothetical protein [Streptococcus sp. DTU_2020_1000888_1_SI_GRL_NUU_041A]WNU96082.1 hypothetical protein RSK81_12630 [Streptococcus sp. DTU_2020_1000888_1_SI_GRL_NUU_041A]
MFNKKTFHILIKLFLVATNIHALFLVFSGKPKQIVIGIVILAVFYLFFFFNYIFDTGSAVYARNLSIRGEALGVTVHKGLQYTVKDITSYEVEENYLTKEKWEKLREELNLYAIEFFKRNFPFAPFDILKIGLIAVAVPILSIGALVTDNDGSILLLFLYTLMPSIQVIAHLNHHASRYNAQELMADINLGLVYSTLILAGVLFLYVLVSWFILWRKSRTQ